jgi:sugar lactone lactonase YvrE
MKLTSSLLDKAAWRCLARSWAWTLVGMLMAAPALAQDPVDAKAFQHWVWSTAYRIPAELTSEESGYFSIVEGKNGHIYVGTAKYGDNGFLVDFDPATKQMEVVVDAEKEIGVDRKGFAAQAKIHTRNNVGKSGRIYFGTKQGYPKDGEKRSDYLGGHPMVYDPATGKTRVYDIPIKHQGIISVTPDESRGVAYISTCSDERPIESTHFMILDLESGDYRDLIDCRHMYAFIVVDHLGRAYHPLLGGEIIRYDPRTDKLERLAQTIDGAPPTEASLLADPKSHPINWEISPDRKTLYSVAMSGNQLYAYDLTGKGNTLAGRSLGKLSARADKTDCRALCVAADGTVWVGMAATFGDRGQFLHVGSYRPGDKSPTDHGPIAISNPGYMKTTDEQGNAKRYHHGVYPIDGQTLVPRYVVMGICAAGDGTVYVTTLYPFTVHAVKIPRVAGITTEYRHNSHADVILTRVFKTDTLDDKGSSPAIRLTSLYTDQVPENDTSRGFAKEYGFEIVDTVADSMTGGTEKLVVDGVMLIAEHGKYPESATGQFVFPKRRLFGEIVETFRRTGQVVPVFNDKHLADNWKDAKWMYDTAKKHKIPLMAGSSLPVLWRYPPVDVRRGEKLKEIVAVSYHRLDAYGFHALEMVQALVERRAGGETGIRAVQCLTGNAVWEAGEQGIYERRLLDEALSRLKERPLPAGKTVEELVPEPILFVIDYNDGLRASVFTLNGAVVEWAVAWRYADKDETVSTLFWTQEARPFHHFNYLLLGIEKMMQTGEPTWPAERTLLTSGVLDALLISKADGGKRMKTPWLKLQYSSDWNWRQPPPPPAGRPINEQ